MSKFSVHYWMFDVYCSSSLFPVPWSLDPSGRVVVRNMVGVQPPVTLKRPSGIGKCSSIRGNNVGLLKVLL